MGMRISKTVGAATALAISIVIVAAAFPAMAADRSKGSYWTYDVIMGIEGFDMTGEATYTSQGEDTIDIDGDSYDVTVMRLVGELTASVNYGGADATAEVTINGFTYELSGSIATVKEDLTMLMNLSYNIIGFEYTNNLELDTVTTYDPALLSGFDEESELGDSWDESINLTMTSEILSNGTSDGETTDEQVVSYTVEVAASLDDVDVDGTTYPCTKITITDEDGNYEMRWYNEDVGYYTQVKEYTFGVSAPLATMKLTDFSNKESGMSLFLLIAGIGIVVAAVVAVALFLLLRRRKPAPMPPMQSVQPGYYAQPPQGPPPPPAPPPEQ